MNMVGTQREESCAEHFNGPQKVSFTSKHKVKLNEAPYKNCALRWLM